MLKIVSNSSPLIHLGKINRLELLKEQFQVITIPEMVHKECIVEGRGSEEAKLIKEADWIKVLKAKNRRLVTLLQADLDAGESEGIVLALEMEADLILLDDADAREKARHLGLKITGTLGVILKEKLRGNLHSLKETLMDLKETGFRISKSLETRLLIEAGEATNK